MLKKKGLFSEEYKLLFNKELEQIEDVKFLLDNEKHDLAVNRAYYTILCCKGITR
jgi:uncharacterized protein (UPF0332 family)